MALCKLCRSIPLQDLPPLPKDIIIVTSFESPEFPRIAFDESTRTSAAPTVGFTYWTDFKALLASATGCELCSLILESVGKVKTFWDNATEEQFSVCRPTPPTFEMQLFGREVGDGFLVITKTEDLERSENSEEFLLVAAVGLSVREGDPLESFWVGRPIEEYSGSQRTINQAAKWLKACDGHSECSAKAATVLPTHVIDLGETESTRSIRLHRLGDEVVTYACLSYCWGKGQNFITTKKTIASHYLGIAFGKLPKTLQDAIVFTKALGVQFIWIDCLCICQDDAEDWNRESTKMAAIYSNAAFTIAATLASDANVGCFAARKSKRYVSIDHITPNGVRGQLLASLFPIVYEMSIGMYLEMFDKDDPLTDRAWALQERLLSRRILHFGKHQMFFECNHGFLGESGLKMGDRYSIPKLTDAQSHKSIQDAGPLQFWHQLLIAYSALKLTKGSDKLPALAGIAQLYAERLEGKTYLAGLWKEFLITDLDWYIVDAILPDSYRAPSWTWAALDGVIAWDSFRPYEEYGERRKACACAVLIDHHIEYKGSGIYGEVVTGWIKLRAPLEPLFLTGQIEIPDWPWAPQQRYHPFVRTKNGDPTGCLARFDLPFGVETSNLDGSVTLTCLDDVRLYALLLSKTYGDVDNPGRYDCLIVCPVEDGSDKMKRLGVLHMRTYEIGQCDQLDGLTERSIVTLI